eukprot:444006-Hanusia_phi.AAC.3
MEAYLCPDPGLTVEEPAVGRLNPVPARPEVTVTVTESHPAESTGPGPAAAGPGESPGPQGVPDRTPGLGTGGALTRRSGPDPMMIRAAGTFRVRMLLQQLTQSLKQLEAAPSDTGSGRAAATLSHGIKFRLNAGRRRLNAGRSPAAGPGPRSTDSVRLLTVPGRSGWQGP